MAWTPIEHLTLAELAFPLLVRCLLQAARVYVLTPDERATIEAFEPFADQPAFLRVSPDPRG
jgi:hypothetical protein